MLDHHIGDRTSGSFELQSKLFLQRREDGG
jgi:hypothetical protein